MYKCGKIVEVYRKYNIHDLATKNNSSTNEWQRAFTNFLTLTLKLPAEMFLV